LEQTETSGGHADAEGFSGREKDVLRLLLQGHSNADMAQRLDVPDAVVRGALRSVYRKLGVRNRTQAAIWAFRNRERLRQGSPETAEARRGAKRGPAED
jgi:DNA-binding NarL/FixJ family response regulator